MLIKVFNHCIEVMKIKTPINLKISTRKNKGAAGLCWPTYRKKKLVSINVKLFLPTIEKSGYDINGILAHEMIHAMQFERNIAVIGEYHGYKFADFAKVVNDYLVDVGCPCKDIYDPNIDNDE